MIDGPSNNTSLAHAKDTKRPEISSILKRITEDLKQDNDTALKSVPAPTEEDWKITLSMLKISLDGDYKQPPVCIEIIDSSGPCRFGTLGNFSAIIGKAKSRKTFFLSLIMGAVFNNNVTGLRLTLPENQKRILYFDTEQSNFDVSRVVKRILTIGEKVNPETFEVYGLRTLTTQQRAMIIEAKIYDTPDAGIVVIDGIRDLINDINSPEEATAITSKLLKWTEERNIHIITILHQNKGDGHARGHVGSEIVNKAESVISVEKEGELSIVRPEFTRGKDFMEFAFGVDQNEIPYILNDWAPKNGDTKKKKADPFSFDKEIHKNILKGVFRDIKQFTWKELQAHLKIEWGKSGSQFGDNKIRDFITYYLDQKMIVKTDTGRYPTYSLC